jgi:hypothetical protein
MVYLLGRSPFVPSFPSAPLDVRFTWIFGLLHERRDASGGHAPDTDSHDHEREAAAIDTEAMFPAHEQPPEIAEPREAALDGLLTSDKSPLKNADT